MSVLIISHLADVWCLVSNITLTIELTLPVSHNAQSCDIASHQPWLPTGCPADLTKIFQVDSPYRSLLEFFQYFGRQDQFEYRPMFKPFVASIWLCSMYVDQMIYLLQACLVPGSIFGHIIYGTSPSVRFC